MNKYYIQDGMIRYCNEDGYVVGFPMVSLCTLLNRNDKEIKTLKKALQLAVADKCELENKWLKNILKLEGGENLEPKNEQWYIDKAKEKL